MAYPTVVQVKKGATTASNTTTHAITMPDSIVVDDIIVVLFSTDGNPLVTQSGGWTRFIQETNGNVVKGQVWYKRATSTSESLTLTTDTGEQSSHMVYQLRNSTPPMGTARNGNSINSTIAPLDTGTSREYLWIVSRHGDSTVTASAAPTGYGDLDSQAAAGTGGASTSSAYKTATASSDSPDAFTSTTENWATFILAFAEQGSFSLRIGMSPTTSNDDSYGSIAWTNPENASDIDETYATVTTAGLTPTEYLKGLDFGLDIPTGATILGIEASVKRVRNGGTTGAIVDDTIQLVKGGVVVGDNKAITTAWATADDTTRYGTPSNLWNQAGMFTWDSGVAEEVGWVAFALRPSGGSITFVSAGTGAGSLTTPTPSMPAGATTGDLLILVIEGEGEDANADDPPSGGAWTLIGTSASSEDSAADRTRCTAYWAWYDAGINLTVPDAGDHTIAQVYAFRGVDGTTPLDGVTPSTGSSATNTIPQFASINLIPTTDGAMVLLAFTHGDDGTTITSVTNATLSSVASAGSFANGSGTDGTVGLLYGTYTSLSWEPEDINASDFGFVLSARASAATGNRVANVDAIRILVYYSEPPATGIEINDAITLSENVSITISEDINVNPNGVIKGYGVRITN